VPEWLPRWKPSAEKKKRDAGNPVQAVEILITMFEILGGAG